MIQSTHTPHPKYPHPRVYRWHQVEEQINYRNQPNYRTVLLGFS